MTRARSTDGAAALEFAVLAPVLVLLLTGLVELALLGQTAMVARNAAREGARYAALRDQQVTNRVVAYLNGALAGRPDVTVPGPGAISVSPWPIPAQGSQVTVTVPVQVEVSLPFISAVLPDPFTVTGTASMRVSAL